MSTRTVVVSEANRQAHEAAMAAQGMYLVGRQPFGDGSWGYIWTSVPPAPRARARPEPTTVTEAATRTDQTNPGARLRPAGRSAGSDSFDALTDDLIAAYQKTLTEAKQLPDGQALVVHVVAASASRASQQARQLRSEHAAERLKRFRDDLPDWVGKLLGLGQDEATKWVKGQIHTALAGGAVGGATVKFAFWVGAALASSLAGVAALGKALATSGGSGLHLLVVITWVMVGYITKNAHDQLEAARGVTDQPTQLLARSLDDPERRFFKELGTSPPKRVMLQVAGPAAQAGTALLIGAAGFAVGALVVGGLSAFAISSS